MVEKKLNLLIVEDNDDDVFLLQRALAKAAPGRFEARSAGMVQEAIAELDRNTYDVALVDLSLPDSHGLGSFLEIYRHAPDLPVVVLTGNENEELALKALQEGAQDYIVKGSVDGQTLVRSVRYAIERHRRRALEHSNRELTSEVSERKRMQEALETLAAKLERSNRELQQFASVASHDLQEPLRKIIVFGSRLRDKAGDGLNSQARDYLDRMINAGQRMQSLINDLLAFSRVATRAEPFAPVDLEQVARDVIGDLEVLIERVSGRVDLGPLPEIEADPFQMRQLMQNLIANALKFHRKEVSPHVTVREEPVVGGDGVDCCIVVEDNGIGFDEKYADRIFSPFQRLHGRSEYEGSGMGLAITHRIVERHGGKISVKSTVGEGSKFSVTLPRKQPVPEAAEST